MSKNVVKRRISQEKKNNFQSSDNEKEIYFIVSSEQKNFNLKILSEISPQIIYTKITGKENDFFIVHNVFKLNIKKEKDKNNYKIEYIEGMDKYNILFFIKENTFIYDIELKKNNNYIDNIIPLYIKFDLFLEALEGNNENNKIKKLYEETIELYKNRKKFSLLISLFVKIYEQNKDLCSKLLNIFKEINEIENKDRDKEFATYLYTFNQIYSNASNIINKNGYDPVNFFGILLCYLSYYDKNNFSEIIEEFSQRNPDILYEILIIYYSHFKEPLNQNSEFYNNFIGYAINKKKDFNILERILNYIDDIETFIYVINENKANFLKKYDYIKNKPIKLSSNLKFVNKNENRDWIIKLIKEIISFSTDNKILIIYIKSELWINLLEQYNKPDLENINNFYLLRNLYKEYNHLIDSLDKDRDDENKKICKEDINKYYLIDEFCIYIR